MILVSIAPRVNLEGASKEAARFCIWR